MFDDRSRQFKNQYVDLAPVDLSLYQPFVGKDAMDRLKWLAAPLEHKIWSNVNSTFVGGGVAEMLQSIIPFARALGIDCRWFVIEGTQEFFNVTKKFHNLLQGIRQPITIEEIFHAYLDTLTENTKRAKVVAHFITVHDTQPAAMIMSGMLYGHTIWRCHIDTSQASRRIWRFLLPYVNQYSGAVFTAAEFIKENLQTPAYEISPSIDPLRAKNKEYSREEALGHLSDLFHKAGIDPDRPLIVAISRYDIHKNQKGIIRSFKLLKENLKNRSPLLIMLGNTATDDPEGAAMFDFVREEAEGDPDIHLFLNVENNDVVVGSLMRLADCFVHIATREGFGLVVSEAMWQGTPVIGSYVGGIKKQIMHGNTGFLVNPNDYEAVAAHMKTLVEDKAQRMSMGKNAKEFVREHFLLPVMMKKEFELMRYYLEIDNKTPEFRINELTYNEIKQALYGRSIWPFTSDELKKKLESIWEDMQRPE
ncbi:MAG: glycosyltransferase [Candidatus Omnitrophica bacterium]|nr:glycosyltransferase [Candidatus Omnitrophota bacterium]